ARCALSFTVVDTRGSGDAGDGPYRQSSTQFQTPRRAEGVCPGGPANGHEAVCPSADGVGQDSNPVGFSRQDWNPVPRPTAMVQRSAGPAVSPQQSWTAAR